MKRFALYLLTGAAVALAALQSLAQAPFASNLVAYYPFNGNALDASSNGNNGTIIGAVVPAVDRFGTSNGAYYFNGSGSSAIEITNTLYNIGQPGYTISGWFASSNVASGEIQVLFNSIPETGTSIAYDYPSVGYALGSCSGGWDVLNSFGSKTNYTNGAWHQFVFTKSNAVYTTYIDGALDSQITNSAATAYNYAVQGIIGSITPINPGYIQTFIGKLDDFRIYNRALAASEAQELYYYESVQACPPHPAAGVAEVVNGFVVGVTLTDEGCGYSNAPEIELMGGGGSGASAVATITNGYVTGVAIASTGSGYTNAPLVYFYYPLSISSQPQTQIVDAYSNATFSVAAIGTSPLSYQWFLNGTNLTLATNSALVVSNAAQASVGTYTVVVTDPFGSLTSAGAALIMPPYLAQPFAGVVTDWGADTVLSAQAWGTGPLMYQWYDNGVAIQGATSAALDLGPIQFTNAGAYSVAVSSAFGSVSNTPEQVVVNPAGISLRLSPTVVISGTVGYSFTIQSTTDLSNTNSWKNLGALTLTQPVQLWFDTNNDASQPGNATHFYRVLPNQ